MRNLRYLPRSAGTFEPGEQFDEALAASFGDDLYPAVDKIFRDAVQAKFKGVSAHPPAKPDPLHPTAHPGGEPGLAGGIAASRQRVGAITKVVPVILVVAGAIPLAQPRWPT